MSKELNPLAGRSCIYLSRSTDSVMRRVIAVLKMRGSDHDKTIRRLEIEPGGIQVQEAFVGREGLLSGTPRRGG